MFFFVTEYLNSFKLNEIIKKKFLITETVKYLIFEII